MPACRETARSVASDELEHAGFWKRLGVRLHLLMCRHCRRYAAQLRDIADATRQLARGNAEDPERLERLRDTILRAVPPGDEKNSS